MGNPLLESGVGKYEATAFDHIAPEHFEPAVDQRIAATKAEIESMRSSSEPASFFNTIEGLEEALRPVHDVGRVYFSLRACHGDDTMQNIAKHLMPKLSKLENDIYLDQELFQRVSAVYDGADPSLTPEQQELLKKTYRAFVRNGARLDTAGREKLRSIDQELSVLSPKFDNNVLKATNAYKLVVKDEEELDGLPESAKKAAAQTAQDNGDSGNWHFTLHMPSYQPLMKYAKNRALRREIFRAYLTRALSGDCDNQPVVLEIVRLRHERALLLGYASHAHYQIEDRMAETPENVNRFLQELLTASLPKAKAELAQLQALLQEETGSETIKPWDMGYYATKLKEKLYDLDEESLRPYFQLENVLEGAFEHAKRLFDLEFRPIKDVPIYHEDVRVFEVVDGRTNTYLGLFYCDFFPRATKSNGAWCTRYKDQGLIGQKDQRPHVSIVCNFTKPTQALPSLLNLTEVRTLFHEFGHALHNLLSKCQYVSLSGTSVYRDFVELPSQVFENWLKEEDGLNLFAKHYQTGAPMPKETVAKIKKSAKFNAATQMLRQLRFGLLDMAWHSTNPESIADVMEFEQQAIAPASLIPSVAGTCISTSFGHIFAGGYSAGYYSYKWAEVLDADAFELFKEKGLFSKEAADAFRTHILEKGGSEHPMTLYKKFRGREPDPKALLRRNDLL